MQKINSISNKSIAYIYFIVWGICVLVAFSGCNVKSNGKPYSYRGAGFSTSITKQKKLWDTTAGVYILATQYDNRAPVQYPVAQICKIIRPPP